MNMLHAAAKKRSPPVQLPEPCDLKSHVHDTPHDEADVVTINVAGKRFQTYNKALKRYPNTLLGDEVRRAMYYNPDKGEYFFNRHRSAFKAILFYYQSPNGELVRPNQIPIHIFLNELIFFDMGTDVIDGFQIEAGIKEVHVDTPRPKWKPFRIVWDFLDDPDSSRIAKLFAITTVLIIVLSLIMFVMETLPEFSEKVEKVDGRMVRTPSKHAAWMAKVNTAVIAWFTVEYIGRLIVCPNKVQFLTSLLNTIDLLSILPYYVTALLPSGNSTLSILRVVRVVRVLRVFKLSRHSRGLQILGNTLKASVNELVMLAFFLSVVILIFGSCVYYAESGVKGTKFTSIPASFWWAIVTMTTVGYGDMAPVTFWGQIVGGLAVVCGVLTIALPVPVVVSNFEHFYTKERNRKRMEDKKNQAAGNGNAFMLKDSVSSCAAATRKRLMPKCRNRRKEEHELTESESNENQTRSNGEAVFIAIPSSDIDVEYQSTV